MSSFVLTRHSSLVTRHYSLMFRDDRKFNRGQHFERAVDGGLPGARVEGEVLRLGLFRADGYGLCLLAVTLVPGGDRVSSRRHAFDLERAVLARAGVAA